MSTIVASPPALAFTAAESIEAHDKWKASCGPHSIAAACAISLERVRPALSNFKGWMSPTHIGETLRRLGKPYILTASLETPALCEGICRVQFIGPWLDRGVPAKEAYHHTHYIAHRSGWVLCTAISSAEWVPVDRWRRELAVIEPFYITHHYEIPQ